MTALKGRAIKAFLANPDREIAAVLVYGPDAGLARERAEHLAKRIAPDLKDPFNAIELSDADLKDEPGKLADEIAALSFAGGERAIRLRTSGETAAKPAETLLKGLDSGQIKPNGMVIIEGGDLSPRSGLRKMFEKARRGAALPCYADAPADVRDMAREAARAENLRFDEDALDLLVAQLGGDHGLSRAEIDKLILYKGPGKSANNGSGGERAEPRTISIDDVRASLVDSQGGALDDAAGAALGGEAKALSAALYKADAAGASPIGLIRALARQTARLSAAQSFVEGGDSPAAAMKKLRPPVFFAEQNAFERRLRRWSGARLQLAQRLLVEAELEAKTTGAPSREIIERAAMRLVMMAAQRGSQGGGQGGDQDGGPERRRWTG